MQKYGWIYNVKLIADHENIPMSQAWEMPTIEALNILSYLKALDKHMEFLRKRQQQQFRNG